MGVWDLVNLHDVHSLWSTIISYFLVNESLWRGIKEISLGGLQSELCSLACMTRSVLAMILPLLQVTGLYKFRQVSDICDKIYLQIVWFCNCYMHWDINGIYIFIYMTYMHACSPSWTKLSWNLAEWFLKLYFIKYFPGKYIVVAINHWRDQTFQPCLPWWESQNDQWSWFYGVTKFGLYMMS